MNFDFLDCRNILLRIGLRATEEIHQSNVYILNQVTCTKIYRKRKIIQFLDNVTYTTGI